MKKKKSRIVVWGATNMEYLVISGMSGAGKSLAVDVLEDMGYYCIDNMPVFLIANFLTLFSESKTHYEKVAFVIDSRGGEQNYQVLFDALTTIHERGDLVKILFLTASDEVLINRQKASRRRHPLDVDRRGIDQALQMERTMLLPISRNADYTIDTSSLTTAGLKSHIEKLFGQSKASMMAISINTFGFKHGIPRDADLVFDVRFLPNPYYIPEMKERTGCDADVAAYVFSTPEAETFMEKLTDLLAFLIPQYMKEGKTSLVISVGCTGGRHRSVAVGERLCSALNQMGHSAVVFHRDFTRR